MGIDILRDVATIVNMNMVPVPPKSLNKVIAFLNRGGSVCVPTQTRITIINKKTWQSFEKAGVALLTEEGDGYRMVNGKTSVYILPGQLKAIQS